MKIKVVINKEKKTKIENVSENLAKTIQLLTEGGYTSVVICKDGIFTSRERGVKPLVELYDRYGALAGASCADKVVGRAAAFIYVRLGISELYADVISSSALEVIRDHGITVAFDEEVPAIRNRTDDGFCPMENAVMSVSSPEEAIAVIKERLESFRESGR